MSSSGWVLSFHSLNLNSGASAVDVKCLVSCFLTVFAWRRRGYCFLTVGVEEAWLHS